MTKDSDFTKRLLVLCLLSLPLFARMDVDADLMRGWGGFNRNSAICILCSLSSLSLSSRARLGDFNGDVLLIMVVVESSNWVSSSKRGMEGVVAGLIGRERIVGEEEMTSEREEDVLLLGRQGSLAEEERELLTKLSIERDRFLRTLCFC